MPFTGLAVRASLFPGISDLRSAVYRGTEGFFHDCQATHVGAVGQLFSLQKEHIP
jgi:hypothetical protein